MDAPSPGHPATADRSSIIEALDQPSLCAAFQVAARAGGARPALTEVGSDVSIDWQTYAERVERIATGLAALGIGPGDVVCVMVRNRPEFHLVDTAVLHLGAIGCSVYLTSPPDEIAARLRNADARVVVADAQHLDAMTAGAAQVGTVQHVVVVDGPADAPADGPARITLEELERTPCPGFDFEASWRAVRPEAIASLGFTSGTTGEPKGVQFSHASLLFDVRSIDRLSPPSVGGRMVSYLPVAHLGERYMSHYSSLVFGYELTSLADGRRILDALLEVRPTRFFAVPRVYEKLAARLRETVAAEPERQAAFDRRLARLRERHDADTGPEDLQALEPVRASLGLQNAEYLGVGSAPPSIGMLEAFHAAGLPVLECYGMSETALVLSNRAEDARIGTVGRPMPGVEAKLAEDGEVLIRGQALFTDYRHNEVATAEAFDADGWFHTGDVGAIDADGYWRIVDRKKELLITATGKNVAPTMVENFVTQGSALIGRVAAIGDRQRWISALIVLDPEELAARGLPTDAAVAAQDPAVLDEVAAAVAAANTHLSKAEHVRSWRVLPTIWAPGGEEMTASMKLKRRAIGEKYEAEIAALYA
jgi:long-subunit acyl-CoA synthetase (AMP-forming)